MYVFPPSQSLKRCDTKIAFYNCGPGVSRASMEGTDCDPRQQVAFHSPHSWVLLGEASSLVLGQGGQAKHEGEQEEEDGQGDQLTEGSSLVHGELSNVRVPT